MSSITFREFASINRDRSTKWHSGTTWSLSDWMVAFLGEAGEAANVLKKLNRFRDGVIDNTENEYELRTQLGEELADALTYLFLLADAAEVDLEREAVEKFNKVSAEHGFSEQL